MKIGLKHFLPFIISLTISLACAAQNQSFKSINDELQTLKQQIVPDSRVALLQISLTDTLKPVVVLKGKTSLAGGKKQVVALLQARQIHFIDSLLLLPDLSVGDHQWGLASLSVSTLRAGPDDAAELVTQVMMGTPLKLLERHQNWYRVQTPESYLGWIDGTGMQPLTESELEQWKASERCFVHEMGGFVLEKPSRRAAVVSDLVLGDLLQVMGHTRHYWKVRLPDGRMGFVHRSACTKFDTWINGTPTATALINNALKLMGSPYLWGGTSSKAVDCSGFTKIIYYSQAIILARDASQQARYGEVLPHNDTASLKPADLLFFGKSTSRITHTGIYLGNGEFIHASGRVQISSIMPSSTKYLPSRNYVAARRILGAPRSEGLIAVKDHPWYTSIVR